MAATFTEKAAKELVTRITNELDTLNIPLNLNDMYVGTFHSICLRIIKEHLEYARVKKNYRMLDQFDQKYMIFQHINRFKQAFSSYRKVSDIGKTDPKKMITDVDNFFQNSEKPSTTGRIIRLGQVGKTDPRNIYLKNNNTEKDITSIQSVATGRDTRDQKDDANDMTDEYISLIKKNIGYPEMCDTLGSLEGQIYENMYRVIVDTVCSRIPDDRTVSIGKEQKPFRIVKNVFLKLRYEHLELAMMNMDKSRKPVTDMKQYLKTVLYNSYLTIDTQISQDLKSSGVI